MFTTMQRHTCSLSPVPVNTDLPDHHSAKLHAAGKESAVFTERHITKNTSNGCEPILDVQRGSTIAEEHNKEKFWTMYEKVSNEYDNNFIEQANHDMDVILVFAGLFSAVNTIFIVGMQPNPGANTNLMLQLVEIIADNTNTVNGIKNLSSSTRVQILASSSLAFSVLAAFGAVLGKQWLNSYNAVRGQGSLEHCGLQRQMKLDGLERWHLRIVLRVFLVLLLISFLLFGLSFSPNVLSPQNTVTSIIIYTAALCTLFYVATMFISALHPDCPFQTAGSALLRAICTKFPPITLTPTPGTTISAIRWILETSAHPEVVEAAAGMVPCVQWPPELEVSLIYSRICDIFVTCVRGSEPFMTCGKALTHLRVHSLKPPPVTRRENTTWLSCADRSHFIRDAFMDACFAYLQLQNMKDGGDQQRHMVDARTALRTMVVHGLTDHLSLPDDEELIWLGDFLWCHSNGHTPSYEDFDWLINYLVDVLEDRRDYDTAGDALLALSAMRGLGSSTLRPRYVDALIRCMDTNRPRRLRYAALRVVSDARAELSSITYDQISRGVDATPLDALSCAILGVAQHFRYDDDIRNRCYLRLISSLAKDDEWCKRLTRDRHLEWCNYLLDNVLESPFDHNKTYLTMIFLRVDPSDKDRPAPPQKRWRLIKRAWNIWGSYLSDDLDSVDIIDALPALVTATRQNVSDPNNDSVRAGLARDVCRILRWLEERSAIGQAGSLVDAAIPVVQDLYNELSTCAAEHPVRRQ